MAKSYELNTIASYLPPEIDLFICSASFEERCRSLPKAVGKQLSINFGMVCYISDLYQLIIDNSQILTKDFHPKEINSLIELDSRTPLSNALAMNVQIDKYLESEPLKNVLVDISTFTHENLIIIMRLLYIKRNSIQNLYLGYVGAKAYDVKQKNIDLKWLSSGINTTRTVIGYPGVISPAKKNHLIILFGFELDRTQALIDSTEFNEISLGFAMEDESIEDENFKINRDRHKKLLSKYTNALSFNFSLTDPLKAKSQVEEQISKLKDYNVVIAAMNNKISTIGASLAAIDNRRIQLIYVKPVEYNTVGYSDPKESVYIHKLELP